MAVFSEIAEVLSSVESTVSTISTQVDEVIAKLETGSGSGPSQEEIDAAHAKASEISASLSTISTKLAEALA